MSDNINFELKKIGDISIFKLSEKRFDAPIAGLVKGEFTIMLHTQDVKKLILDLSEIDYCDSSGLSAILLAYRILQAEEGYIRLAAPTRHVKKLIEISQLDRILPIFDSVEAAISDLENK
ncbi:MAG: STAS domain-containing protein [Bacteroidetes bacterium]|nr:STAS domain-containing protein [Bacteroidota bacterium]MBU1681153.1 STAS domain-containing protein [Bacteroidota bacterium]MBU2505715.1 STAS domain-containing protein [Bacteroidota bacterium]